MFPRTHLSVRWRTVRDGPIPRETCLSSWHHALGRSPRVTPLSFRRQAPPRGLTPGIRPTAEPGPTLTCVNRPSPPTVGDGAPHQEPRLSAHAAVDPLPLRAGLRYRTNASLHGPSYVATSSQERRYRGAVGRRVAPPSEGETSRLGDVYLHERRDPLGDIVVGTNVDNPPINARTDVVGEDVDLQLES